MRRPDRHVDEHPGARRQTLVSHRERDLAGQDVESFFLPAVDVRGWTPPGGTIASHKAYLPFVSSPVARNRYTSPTTATVRPSPGFRITACPMVVSFIYTGAFYSLAGQPDE